MSEGSGPFIVIDFSRRIAGSLRRLPPVIVAAGREAASSRLRRHLLF